MVGLAGKEEVLSLTKELILEGASHLDKYFILHISDTYDIAGETVERACFYHSELKQYLNEKEISLAGGLHDIGRIFEKKQLFHELKGARFIEENGLELGVADTTENVYRVAQMFRSHGFVTEKWSDPQNVNERKKFEPLDPFLLIPRTWHEAIIVFSDLNNVRGKHITVEERMADLEKRYVSGTKFYDSDPSACTARGKGLEKVLKICKRVKRLREGKLSMPEIMRYGFI